MTPECDLCTPAAARQCGDPRCREAGHGQPRGTLHTLAQQCIDLAARLEQADRERLAPAHITNNITLRVRDHELLVRCARGHTNAEIAADLCISEETVRTQMRRLFDTLGARTRAHAVAIGYQLRLLDEHTPIRPAPRGDAA